MITVYSDQSKQVNWTVRKQTDATLTLNVTVSGIDHDLSIYTFIAEFYKVGNSSSFLSLTQGSGITNNGAAGSLLLSLTDTQLNLNPEQYFWKLRTTVPTDNLWFNGIFKVNEYIWDGTTDSSANVELTIGGNELNIDLTIAAGQSDFMRFRGVHNASGNTMPSGTVLQSYVYKISVRGDLPYLGGTIGVEVGEFWMANVDSPGNDMTKWDKL